MGVVTLTGHLGSMGEIARLCARELGYDLMDRELALEAARSIGLDESEVAKLDERTDGFGGRLRGLLLDFLERSGQAGADIAVPGGVAESVLIRSYAETAGPEMGPQDERYIAGLRELMVSLGERGGIVLVGRGAQAILAEHPGALHVRVACERGERIRRVVERDHMAPDEARKRVEHSDEQREAWHRKYFGIDYRQPYHYHLVVNSGRLTDAQAAGLVVQAARSVGVA